MISQFRELLRQSLYSPRGAVRMQLVLFARGSLERIGGGESLNLNTQYVGVFHEEDTVCSTMGFLDNPRRHGSSEKRDHGFRGNLRGGILDAERMRLRDT